MKTFQKLLTNSLLFAENRMCNVDSSPETGGEAPQKSADGKFEVGQVIQGFGLTEDDDVKVEKIEKAEGYDKVTLSDKTVIERIRFEFKKDEKAETQWVFCRKLNTGTYVDEDGEQPLEFVPSNEDLIPESEAIKQLEKSASEAKKKLGEKKEKALESVSEPTKEKATRDIEEEYKKAAGKIDALLVEAKTKIAEEKNDEGEVEKSTAEELAKTFNIDVEEASEEGKKAIDFEAEIKGKLKDPEELHAWLKDPASRKKMRELVLIGNTGEKKYTVDFKKAKEALNLSDKEYKIVEMNLRIGNLLEDNVIKKITSVKTKGKEMTAKYFYEGGKKVKGVYTEKNKYIPIWDGTEISFGTEDLEAVKAGDKGFEKKVAKAKASAPAEGGAKAKGAEPAPGTPEAAATSPESRTAQGLDSTPVKPLEPAESEDVAGAKEFNGITYKPNGANFDIIDTDTKEVTNTVDATTLAVLEGREVPTQEWMKAKIHEAFPYLKPDAELTYEYINGMIKAFIPTTNGYFFYNLVYKDAVLMGGENINLGQYLANTDASTLAQLRLDVGSNNEIQVGNLPEGSLQEAIVKKEYVKVIELAANEANPDVEVLASAIRGMTKSDSDQINTDLTNKIKPLLVGIIEIWQKEEIKISKDMIAILESINGGALDQTEVEALISNTAWENNFDKNAFYSKYKSNPKVVEWYLKEGSPSDQDILLSIKDYTGQPADEVVAKLADVYSESVVDSLSLKDEEKTALKTKCKEIFTNYLTTHAKDESPAKYQEIYKLLYGDDITKLPDGASKPSPEVYAKNFVLVNQDPFAAGIFDGTGWLASAVDSAETQKYISACLDAMTTVPWPVPIEQPDPAKEKSVASVIMELAKQSQNPLARIFAASIELFSFSSIEGRDSRRLEEVKNLKKTAENTEDPGAYEAVIALGDNFGAIKEMLKTEAGRTALGFENIDKFNTWFQKQRALIRFAKGEFRNVDADQLDPAQKEFVEAYNDPSKINSYNYLKRILATKGVKSEHLKVIADNSDSTLPWAKVELYLALGLKGKAKETADNMSDEVEKNYYLSLFAETKKDKLALLEKAISEVTPKKEENLTAADLELRVRILKELKNAGKTPDQYKYKGVNASILENLSGVPMVSDPDKKDFYNAVLDIKLLNAETEIAQCEDPDNPFASDHEGACDYKELVNEVKAYNESLPEGQEMDKAMLERLHVLIGANTGLLKDEDTKKAYASLMVKIDKTEGLEDYITQDAEYLESKGKYLEAAKLITDTSTPESLSKKKDLLSKALTQAGEDADKKAEIAAEYANIDDQESQEKAVEIYMSTKKHYDKAIDLMKDSSNKISIGFIKSRLDDLTNPEVDLADDAETICLRRGSMQKDLIKIYREKKDKKSTKVELKLLLNSAADDPSLNEPIFELLNDDDKRKEKDFAEVTSEAKKVFCLAIKDKLTTNTVKNRIKGKLGITDMDAFLKGEETTEQPADTAEQTEAPTDTVPEAPKDHTYVVEGDEVTIKAIDGKNFTVKLNMPEGFTANQFEDSVKKKRSVFIYDKDDEPQAYIKLNEKNIYVWGYVNRGEKDNKYTISYKKGTFTIAPKPTEPAPQESPADPQPPKQEPTSPAESPAPPSTEPLKEEQKPVEAPPAEPSLGGVADTIRGL